MNFEKSLTLFNEAEKVIPGGVTSARHPSKFIQGYYPIFMNKGYKAHVWDVDGNEFIDWILSFGPIVLGHANKQVDKAVKSNLDNGFCFTMVHPVQNELAKKLIDIIPCAEMVKFVTSGSDATSAAIRIARVFTGKDKVIRWGYHGWHDWAYGGAGTDRLSFGVPEGIKRDVLTFNYNDLDSLEDTFKKYKGEVACVIMQPFEASKELPREGFLEGVKEIAHKNDAVLIFDEIRTGFRMALGGAQEYFNVIPDMTAVSKAIANGYPISAVVGKREIMENAKKTRISATFLVNSFPMIAALETIKILEEENGIAYMWELGNKLINGIKSIINKMEINAEVVGVPPLPFLRFTDKNDDVRDKLKTKFYQETTNKGVLFHPNHHWFLSLGHTVDDVNRTLEVMEESMKKAKNY